MDVIIASSNEGKIKEFRAFLTPYGINLISLHDLNFNDEIEETGTTFFENALIKAKTIYDKYHLPVISDDSGLCCEALDGAPGIYSARFHNLNTERERRLALLADLEGKDNRNAYFHTSIIFMIDDNKYYEFVGKCYGYIAYEERGDRGFGYDYIFCIPEGKTFAEVPIEKKNEMSHRGIAMRKFKEFLDNDFNNK